jgi:hypothetical protein
MAALIREHQGLSKRPILLLADSMFKLCKPSSDLFPMSYSGQRAVQLRWMLETMQVRAEVSDIVVNHGLNHTRCYGNPKQDMEAVFHWLSTHYPLARLYHLQPPISPVAHRSPSMRHVIFTFSQMMIEVGFLPIEHPALPRVLFDNDGFHYTKGGMQEVSSHVIRYVRSHQ